MISCSIRTDLSECGRHLHTCRRCGKSWRQVGLPKEWKGDPVYCKGTPAWWEFGCWVNIILEVFGINTKRYSWLKQKLGLNPKCPCNKREQSLNTLGARFKQGLLSIWGKIRAFWNKE